MPIRSIVDPADGDQTLTVGGGARIIQGTGNVETINVLDGTEVEARLGGGADRVNLTRSLSDYTITQQGFTDLQLEDSDGNTVTLTVNDGTKTLAFADGSAEVTAAGGTLSIGGQAIGAGQSVDPSAVELDPSDPSPIGEGGGTSTELPSLPPSQGGDGPAEVQAGTEAGDNIDADQDGATLSGQAGEDRFIVSDPVSTQQLTIKDFEDGDQLFFFAPADLTEDDVTFTNSDANDNELVISIGGTEITLNNLPQADADPVITGPSSFESTFSSNNALNFPSEESDGGGSNGDSDGTVTTSGQVLVDGSQPSDPFPRQGDTLTVGSDSDGTLEARDGAQLIANAPTFERTNVQVGAQAGADGTLSLSGRDTRLTAEGSDNLVSVGVNGSGEVNLENGASLNTLWLRVGDRGSGTVNVTGTETELILSTDFGRFTGGFSFEAGFARIGHRPGSTGTLDVQDGGQVTVRPGAVENTDTSGPGISLGEEAGSTGELTVRGQNSRLDIVQSTPFQQFGPFLSAGSGLATVILRWRMTVLSISAALGRG